MERLSLLQQWTAATILAIIPLLLAVTYAAYALHQQTQNERQLVGEMDSLSQKSGAISENIKEMVRLSRQYSLLKDPRFLDLFQQKLAATHSLASELEPLLPSHRNGDIFNKITTSAESVKTLLTENELFKESNLAPLLETMIELNDKLTREIDEYRKRELKQGEERFQTIFNQLFFLTILALPGTFLLMIIGTYRVSRPLWRLSQAIRQLGGQQWEKPISIKGPSDLMELGDSLEWMRQQVISSDRQKTAFIQHVTHELKTPLSAIIEAGNLLDEEVAGPVNKEQRPLLDILRTNARNLEHLIQQLLNYNAVTHGIVTHWQDIDMQVLCRAIRTSLEGSRPEKRVTWQFEGAPPEIRSDPRLIEMILRNLMGNAFQYVSPGGNIRVHWLKNRHDWDLVVSDDGPGLDPDEIEHIYLPFFKGRSGKQHKMSKTGVGLSIVYECVSLLKGTIEAHSSPGEGAHFYMSFPVIEIIDS